MAGRSAERQMSQQETYRYGQNYLVHGVADPSSRMKRDMVYEVIIEISSAHARVN